MDEIPLAGKNTTVKEDIIVSVYERQKKECIEKIKKLSNNKPFVSLVFKEPFEVKLLHELESRGYVVKFNLSYDKDYLCRVKISDPEIVVNKPVNDFLGNIDLNFLNKPVDEESLKTLISNFFNP